MKKSRYTPEQVAFGLRQAESGTPVPEVCRKKGMPQKAQRIRPLCRYSRSGCWARVLDLPLFFLRLVSTRSKVSLVIKALWEP